MGNKARQRKGSAVGTRGLLGLVADDKVYGTYNHYDSYPSYLGVEVAKFVRHVQGVGIPAVKAQAAALRLIDEDTDPTDADREQFAALTDSDVSTGRDWYSLLRNAQGDLKAYLDAGVWIDNLDFAEDSLFCEYGYLVNLDRGVVEFYLGFNKGPAVGRFANLPKPERAVRNDYGPITLAVEVPFAQAADDEVWKRLQRINDYDRGEDNHARVIAGMAGYIAGDAEYRAELAAGVEPDDDDTEPERTKRVLVSYSYTVCDHAEVVIGADEDSEDEDVIREALSRIGREFSDEEEFSLDAAAVIE